MSTSAQPTARARVLTALKEQSGKSLRLWAQENGFEYEAARQAVRRHAGASAPPKGIDANAIIDGLRNLIGPDLLPPPHPRLTGGHKRRTTKRRAASAALRT